MPHRRIEVGQQQLSQLKPGLVDHKIMFGRQPKLPEKCFWPLYQRNVRHGNAVAKTLASTVHHGPTTSAALSAHPKLTDTETGSALLAMGILQHGRSTTSSRTPQSHRQHGFSRHPGSARLLTGVPHGVRRFDGLLVLNVASARPADPCPRRNWSAARTGGWAMLRLRSYGVGRPLGVVVDQK